ncbi:hypothetical protein SARC_09083 [Sphaeroforma arctica JP610]|uniref:Diacylglycerol kinase n=1 Tax=Sphaeroforma arctica JP610 TaxID=667725 RepID=A0A0L0FNT0_9EUKA|nr:hypothetical protein SARC_09083 [Sphaeroforma arctica JP610]KNC78490.1 hypothetical protein SARC_09083 [Sphaeroforma arctica JP610]|eukprot:XP_014152392.1 hypothetical protein SARC_09083 [Sphaeroforma arctica JP610]
MGGTSSSLTSNEVRDIAEQYQCAPRKIKIVWAEYQEALWQQQNERLDSEREASSPGKVGTPRSKALRNKTTHRKESIVQNESLDFEAFRTFCSSYFNIDTTCENSVRHLFGSFDKDGDGMVSFDEIMVSAMVLDNGTPEEKLQFLFQAYCRDVEAGLNIETQLGPICDQMVATNVAMGRNVEGLKPTLMKMLRELDRSGDGFICEEEWVQGGVKIVPLLVLLGLDQSTYNLQKRVEGAHMWKLTRRRSALSTSARKNFCAICLENIKAESLTCNSCGATVHMVCSTVSHKCRPTYSLTEGGTVPQHFWVAGGYKEDRCISCLEKTKENTISYKCSWCKSSLHDVCKTNTDGLSSQDECTLGQFRNLIIPYTGFHLKPVNHDKSISDIERLKINDTVEFSRRKSSSSYDELSKPLEIIPTENSTPLLVLINPGSGGQQGEGIIDQLSYMLNPRQVFDVMAHGGPGKALQQFYDVPGLRLLVAGGDGTVGWVMSEIDKLNWQDAEGPPIAILPLGTGNDLARCYGWGAGYTGGRLSSIARKILASRSGLLDRWSITVKKLRKLERSDRETEACDPLPLSIINNYFSIGVDASIAVKFHQMRQSNPGKFSSRSRNKIIYGELAASEIMSRRCMNMHKHMKIKLDGEDIDIASGPSLQCLVMLNIVSMYAGCDIWGTKTSKNFKAQAMDDKIFEVAGIADLKHMTTITAGIGKKGHRIGQGSVLQITTDIALPMQIDGEPWLQSPCQIKIKFHNQARVLQPESPVQTELQDRSSVSSLLG